TALDRPIDRIDYVRRHRYRIETIAAHHARAGTVDSAKGDRRRFPGRDLPPRHVDRYHAFPRTPWIALRGGVRRIVVPDRHRRQSITCRRPPDRLERHSASRKIWDLSFIPRCGTRKRRIDVLQFRELVKPVRPDMVVVLLVEQNEGQSRIAG